MSVEMEAGANSSMAIKGIAQSEAWCAEARLDKKHGTSRVMA